MASKKKLKQECARLNQELADMWSENESLKGEMRKMLAAQEELQAKRQELQNAINVTIAALLPGVESEQEFKGLDCEIKAGFVPVPKWDLFK